MLVTLYGEERDRLARVATACLDSGISKIEVELAQETTEQTSGAINNAIKSVGLNDQQRKKFGEVLRLELQQLQREAVEPETASLERPLPIPRRRACKNVEYAPRRRG